MIRVSIEVQDQLKAMRKKDEHLEAIGDVVKRLILDNRRLLAENNAYHKQGFPVPTQPSPGSLMPMSTPVLSDVPMKFNDPSA